MIPNAAIVSCREEIERCETFHLLYCILSSGWEYGINCMPRYTAIISRHSASAR